jgi:predicted permease
MPGDRTWVFPAYGLLFLGALLVLLLACANVGNLLLARATARGPEIATRLSLGAGRGRLIRQLLTESLVLAVMSSAIGIGLAHVLPPFVMDQGLRASGEVGSFSFVLRPDGSGLAYTAGLTVVTCLLFGLAPALHASRPGVAAAVKGQGAIPGFRFRLRGGLLAAQMAISVVLLVVAGLLGRTVERARDLDLGFDIDDVTVMFFELPRYYEYPRTRAFARSLVEGARALEGSGSFGFASNTPFGVSSGVSLSMPGGDPAAPTRAELVQVSPAYFEILRIPMVAGRRLELSDAGGPAVLVNETLATHCCAGTNPLGRTLRWGKRARQIVGVVRDARTGRSALRDAVRTGTPGGGPAVYEALDAAAVTYPVPILLRRAGPGTTQALADLAARLDRQVRVRMTTLAERRDRALLSQIMRAWLASLVAALALAIAAVGVFGVFAYVGQQRTREIGIRMALGARPGQVLRGIFRSSARAISIGLATGGVAAAAGSQLLRNQISGVSPLAPVTYLRVGALLFAVGLAATYLPARRAARVDPAIALRRE